MRKYLSVVLLFALVGFLWAEGTLIERHINILIVFQNVGNRTQEILSSRSAWVRLFYKSPIL